MIEHPMETGIYLNLFQVKVPNTPTILMQIDRSRYTDLRLLRDELKNKKVWVYADVDKIYGYGKDSSLLKDKGFEEIEITPQKVPRLTARMALDGFLETLKQNKYEVIEKKGRCEVFNWTEFNTTSDMNVKVFRGFDLKSIFLLDSNNYEIVFGLVVDVAYAFKDKEGVGLSPRLIRQNFGTHTFSEVRQIQEELIPTGINTEVARQRLLEHILPFVKCFSEFMLPSNLKATLHLNPTRIILGGEK